jgi:hypothetical protein
VAVSEDNVIDIRPPPIEIRLKPGTTFKHYKVQVVDDSGKVRWSMNCRFTDGVRGTDKEHGLQSVEILARKMREELDSGNQE